MSNAERIFEVYFNGGYFKNSDKLRLVQGPSTLIYYKGTMIGYIIDEEYEPLDRYIQMVVLTLQDYKSDKSWKRTKQELAKAANKYGLAVLFVPEFDIGFGVNKFKQQIDDYYCEDLIKIAKYSQDKEIKSACCAINLDDKLTETMVYSYNQRIDDEYVHAEDIICSYLILRKDVWHKLRFISMLEPCYNCLRGMVECGAEDIRFVQLHKSEWDTLEYIQLTNDIFNKTIVSNSGRRVLYIKIPNNRVDKFYGGTK